MIFIGAPSAAIIRARSCSRSRAGRSSAMRIERQPSAGFSSLRLAEIGQHLVGADVERAEGDGLALRLLDDGLVMAHLLASRGKRLAIMNCSSVR